MLNVYFEKNSCASLVAAFDDEHLYIACLPILERECEARGFDMVTESVIELVQEYNHTRETSN
jgi:hypothetical protein